MNYRGRSEDVFAKDTAGGWRQRDSGSRGSPTVVSHFTFSEDWSCNVLMLSSFRDGVHRSVLSSSLWG